MWREALKAIEVKMNKTIEAIHQELLRVRTGRANPTVLDAVRVDYYGTSTSLKQLATVSTPEPRTLVIQPFDAGSLKEIEKAIASADLGFTPMVDGRLIRIVIPPLSKERREELVKVVKRVAEEGHVSIRTLRRDANEAIKKLEKDKKITEDDRKKAEVEIQKLTDRSVQAIDNAAQLKEKDLLTV